MPEIGLKYHFRSILHRTDAGKYVAKLCPVQGEAIPRTPRSVDPGSACDHRLGSPRLAMLARIVLIAGFICAAAGSGCCEQVHTGAAVERPSIPRRMDPTTDEACSVMCRIGRSSCHSSEVTDR